MAQQLLESSPFMGGKYQDTTLNFGLLNAAQQRSAFCRLFSMPATLAALKPGAQVYFG
jgi:hypothetical protein